VAAVAAGGRRLVAVRRLLVPRGDPQVLLTRALRLHVAAEIRCCVNTDECCALNYAGDTVCGRVSSQDDGVELASVL